MAAYAGIDSFDSYSDGDLNGSNGGSGWSGAWSGSVLFDVQGTVVRPGGSTKAVVVTSANWNSEPVISRTLTTAADSGDIYYSIRKSVSAGGVHQTLFYNGGTLAFYTPWDNTGKLDLVGTTTVTIFSSGSDNTWYDVHISFTTSTTAKARYKLSTDANWGAFTSTVTLSGGANQITVVKMSTGAAGTAPNGYWDNISITDPAASTVKALGLLGVG